MRSLDLVLHDVAAAPQFLLAPLMRLVSIRPIQDIVRRPHELFATNTPSFIRVA